MQASQLLIRAPTRRLRLQGHAWSKHWRRSGGPDQCRARRHAAAHGAQTRSSVKPGIEWGGTQRSNPRRVCRTIRDVPPGLLLSVRQAPLSYQHRRQTRNKSLHMLRLGGCLPPWARWQPNRWRTLRRSQPRTCSARMPKPLCPTGPGTSVRSTRAKPSKHRRMPRALARSLRMRTSNSRLGGSLHPFASCTRTR
jgi:hypothetical protein